MNGRRTNKKREHGDDRDEGDLRYLDVALEERLGGLTPPDLRHRLLAANKAQRQAAAQRVEDAAHLQGPTRPLWVAAAVVVLGLGVLFAVLHFTNASETGTVPIQDRGQDASQDASQDGALVRPTTKAEFLKHLRAVEAISIEVVTTRKHSHSLSRSRQSRLEIKDKVRVDELRDLMAKSLKPAVPAGWEWPNVILLHMKGGRHMRCSMYLLGAPRLGISGIGDWAMTDALANTLRPLIDKAERNARIREGVVFTRADLERTGPQAVPSDVEKLTCYMLMDDDLALLERFTNLTVLKLDGCSRTLEGPGMAHVARLRTLQHILLKNTAIDDESLAQLGSLPKLSQLNLTYATQITGTGLASFQKTGSLQRLYLSYCRKLSDAGLAAVAGIPSLDYLDLSGGRTGLVTAKGLMALSQAGRLTSLDLKGCPLDMDEAMAGFGNIRDLRVLDLSDTGASADSFTAFHFIHSPSIPAVRHPLRHLYLARCKQIDDKALEVISAYGGLFELDLQGCSAITAAGLDHLTKLHNLKRLHLNQVKITAKGCKHVAALPQVEFLDLSFSGVDDEGLGYIKNMASVTELKLTGARISDKGLALLAQMKRLGRLDLNACDGFTPGGAALLEEALTQCEIKLPGRFRRR
ncbi:MAG: hypothetical protein ACYS5W_06410 [Planctomycetota bacterium]|jgi:hypothetical protein